MSADAVVSAVVFGWSQAFLILHIAAAVIGMGGLRLLSAHSGAIAGFAESIASGTKEGREDRWRLWLLEVFAYLVPIFGAAVVGFEDSWEFDQTWLSLAFLLYALWLGLWIAVMRPGRAYPPAVKAAATGISDLVLAAALFVMVVKPGL